MEAAVAVARCLIADGDTFASRPVESLTLDFAGIPGDFHAGATRKAGSREPWYPRGTEIRNDRQVTIVSREELVEVAALMELADVAPEWIGANLVFTGLAGLSLTPHGTRLFFAGGVTLLVEAENGPCKIAGAAIGKETGRDGFDLLFPKVARHKRGLVASVERPGTILSGETVKVRRPRPPA